MALLCMWPCTSCMVRIADSWSRWLPASADPPADSTRQVSDQRSDRKGNGQPSEPKRLRQYMGITMSNPLNGKDRMSRSTCPKLPTLGTVAAAPGFRVYCLGFRVGM